MAQIHLTYHKRDDREATEKAILEEINLEMKVYDLRLKAAESLHLTPEIIDIVYGGMIMDDGKDLVHYEIVSGVTLHLFQKLPLDGPLETPPAASITFSEEEIQMLCKRFKIINKSHKMIGILQKVTKPEVLKRIADKVPAAMTDNLTLAYMYDFELMLSLSDEEKVRKMLVKHPILIRTAQVIGAHVHNEMYMIASSDASTSTGATSSDNANNNSNSSLPLLPINMVLSDDDEYEMLPAEPMPGTSSSTATPPSTSSTLTAAATPSTSASQSTITNEMFSNAIQQAIASLRSINNNNNGGGVAALDGVRYTEQLRTMHEMGLTNDRQNLHALEATDGDLQAAIGIVLNDDFV